MHSPVNDLFAVLYPELRRLAAAQLRRRNGTVQPTALVHDAWIRMHGGAPDRFHDRAHFLSAAAVVIRNLLVDHDRRRRCQKRNGGVRRSVLADSDLVASSSLGLDLLDLEDALRDLAKLDARKTHVVELRVFAGATLEEIAASLGISRMTASNDWQMAKAWLLSRLGA